MKSIKKMLTGLVLAATFGASAQATVINVSGIYLNPDDPLDFSAATATLTQSLNPSTGVVSGFGVVSTLNGVGSAVFCPGCELTLQYGGYTPVSVGALPTLTGPTGVGSEINYTGGWVKFYVDTTPDANPANPLLLTAANTGDGSLWLDLVGHAKTGGVTLTGFNFIPSFLLGQGLWDVIGGFAAGHLDTNAKDDGADISFTTSFTSFPGGSFLFATGTGNLQGDSIPEPASLALLGLGLLGLGAVRRRKATK